MRRLIPLLIPGAVVVAAITALRTNALPPDAAAVVDFYWYAMLGAGTLLAVRFHASRVLLALVLVAAVEAGLRTLAVPATTTEDGRLALGTIGLVFALNLAAVGLMTERGFSLPSMSARLTAVFVQGVGVAVLCRPGQLDPSGVLWAALVADGAGWYVLPATATVAAFAAATILAVRFVLTRKPAEAGLLGCGVAVLVGLHAGGLTTRAYMATAALALLVSLVETSYQLAYQDELTGLPSRRAFQQATLRLQERFAVAIVDVDHFKDFNDVFGHDIGDQVLRMVGSRLARVGGNGMAFRVGGEEFALLFSGKSAAEAQPYLEELRKAIAQSGFTVRGTQRRRRRRLAQERRETRPRLRVVTPEPQQASVTVSIGLAEPAGPRQPVEDVILAADQALYRAKESGRNRVEIAGVESAAARTKAVTRGR